VRGNGGMACRPNPSHGGTEGTKDTEGRKESTNCTNERIKGHIMGMYTNKRFVYKELGDIPIEMNIF
jgi:hypothetical protein